MMKLRPLPPRPRPHILTGWILLFFAVQFFSAAHLQAERTLFVSGFVDAKAIGVQSRTSWLAGEFGPLLTGSGDTEDDAFKAAGSLQVIVDWEPSERFGAHLHGVLRAEPSESWGDAGGIVEAYVHSKWNLRSADELRLKLGFFFLPTSRENIDLGWSSPYTITFSAINSWIGEETRALGLSADYRLALGGLQSLRFGGAVLGGNDTNGTLLAWRGWGMGDRLTTYGEALPLPPLDSLYHSGPFYKQRDDGTQPFGPDLDDELGWAGWLRWEIPEKAVVQFTRYDNRGDRRLWYDEYAWETAFDLVAVELRPHADWVLAGEWLSGETGMGPYSRRAHVQLDIEAAYALVSWQPGAWRTTLRWDTFSTDEQDFSIGENNDGDGDAWTAALFWEPRQDLRVGFEWLRFRADRPEAALSGNGDPRTDADQIMLELRWFFDL